MKHEEYSGENTAPETPPASPRTHKVLTWVVGIICLLLFIGLWIFILQNLQDITIKYFTVRAQMPAGLALIIAALAGAALAVIFATGSRYLRARRNARRHQK
jgi:uncharacterized integral membrane protein